MHTLTQERPIDDPRYVHFHGVGGELVKFIYPDMYRVPVFENGVLLEVEDIESNIKTYLKEKIQVYNQYLDLQLQKSDEYYSLQADAFDFLEVVDQ